MKQRLRLGNGILEDVSWTHDCLIEPHLKTPLLIKVKFYRDFYRENECFSLNPELARFL